jgi:polyhydroxybutyrate depolymerase
VAYDGILPVINRWKAGNGCASQTVTELPNINPNDGSTVTVFHYFGPDPNSDVFLYRVNGGYHGVPGIEPGYNQDFNSWEVIWNFFKSHTKP